MCLLSRVYGNLNLQRITELRSNLSLRYERKGEKTFQEREDGDSEKREPRRQRSLGNYSKPRVGKGKKRPNESEEKKRPPRLNQYIARAGVCSRREADELIATGKVKVNGRVVREMGLRVHREDKVEYEGKLLHVENATIRFTQQAERFYFQCKG